MRTYPLILNHLNQFVNPFRNFVEKYGWLLVLLIQACLVSVVFNEIVFHGSDYVFCNTHDGAKNYFTLQGYIDHPDTNGLRFSLMNYPYGDCIYYTDNTPLIALLAKSIFSGAPHAVFYFNLLILGGILFTTLLLFKLLKQFSGSVFLAILFSIALPWLSPQALRYGGHFNLTLSCILLSIIYLLAKRERTTSRFAWQDVVLLLTLLLSGFIHIYYLVLSLVFVFSYFCLNAIRSILQKRAWLYGFICGVLICSGALLLFFVILRVTDPYYSLRPTEAQGYDFEAWKLQLRAFYTPYFYHPVSKLLSVASVPYESFAYLGSGTLIGIVGIIVFLLTQPTKLRTVFSEIKKWPLFNFILLLLLASVPGVLIALGEQVQFTDNLTVTNYLNPLFYARKVLPQVGHFRCLGRFAWFFFWTVNLMTLFIVFALFHKRYFKFLLALMIGGCIIDTYYSMRFSTGYHAPNPYSEAALNNVSKKFGAINTSGYQAILAFPFYHVGSENYDYTIDPADSFCTATMQLSLASGLPLINSKLSRTPFQHTHQIFSLFSESISDSLLEQFNHQPVLIFLDKSFYSNDSLLLDKMPQAERMPAKEVLLHGHRIIERYAMKKLFETEEYAWYEWQPPQLMISSLVICLEEPSSFDENTKYTPVLARSPL